MTLQSRADCPANFDLIRSWLRQCEGHPVCARLPSHASEFHLPTRLIDVGPPGSTEDIRLVLSVDIDQSSDCRYIALSHCWGDPTKIPRTHAATLAAHQRQITELSRTFQDAVVVTKEMGFRYLWIDSLCIIQNDQIDFEKECATMHLIYARAYFTLSALDSVDGSGGLFIPRDPVAIKNAIPFAWKEALDGPLSMRGWAHQEQQLSQRVIHFTKQRLLWECRVAVAFEDRPAMRWRGTTISGPGQSATWRLLDGRPETVLNLWKCSTLHTMKDLYTRWLRAMEVYSGRRLSHITDKLPAISGLAASMANTVEKEVYLAGIWKQDLGRGLMWRKAKNAPYEHMLGTTCLRSCIDGIPSWSWASFNGAIVFLGVGALVEEADLAIYNYDLFPYRRSVPIFKAIETDTTVFGLDPFGRVVDGTLTLRGQMAEIRVAETVGQSLNSSVSIISHEGVQIPDAEAYLDVSLDDILSLQAKISSVGETKLSCFKILDQDDLTSRRPGHISGLILMRISEKHYQRIGIYECGDKSNLHLRYKENIIIIII